MYKLLIQVNQGGSYCQIVRPECKSNNIILKFHFNILILNLVSAMNCQSWQGYFLNIILTLKWHNNVARNYYLNFT